MANKFFSRFAQFSAGILLFFDIIEHIYIQRVEYTFVHIWALHFFRAHQLGGLCEFWLFINLCIRNLAVVTPIARTLLLPFSFFFFFFREQLGSVPVAAVLRNPCFISGKRSTHAERWISVQLVAARRIHTMTFSFHSCLDCLSLLWFQICFLLKWAR